jgi:hypothetical protein
MNHLANVFLFLVPSLFLSCAKSQNDENSTGAEAQAWNGSCTVLRGVAKSIAVWSGNTSKSGIMGYVGRGDDAKPILLYLASPAASGAARLYVRVKGPSTMNDKVVWVDSASVDCHGSGNSNASTNRDPNPSDKVCATVRGESVCDTRSNIVKKLREEAGQMMSEAQRHGEDAQKWEIAAGAARAACINGAYATGVANVLWPPKGLLLQGGAMLEYVCFNRACLEGTQAAREFDKLYGSQMCPSNWLK